MFNILPFKLKKKHRKKVFKYIKDIQLTFDISKLEVHSKLLISLSKFSGPRKFTLRYQ